ncbi:MAG: DUF2027 domain-containing protein [Bacteroidales bacterium]
MQFKPGDKVLFLNEKGGGVVTRVEDDQIVHVAVEDGFDIPYAVTDLIKAGGQDEDRPLTAHKRPTPAKDERTAGLHVLPHQTEDIPNGIYLAMVPGNQEQVLSSAMDFYLLNHTGYRVSFALFLNKSGNFFGKTNGTMDPGSKHHLGKVERTDIEEWAHAMLQTLFFREGKTELLPPGADHIVFKPVKIYKEDSFSFSPMLHQKAMTIMVTGPGRPKESQSAEVEVPDAVKYIKEEHGHSTRKSATEHKNKGILEKHMVGDNIAEIDLHIVELTDNTINMTNADMLNMQMDYVKRCLKEARKQHISKLIFIHGIGNGTLKQALLKMFKNTEGLEYFDAPYARYGMGATEVKLFRTGSPQ